MALIVLDQRKRQAQSLPPSAPKLWRDEHRIKHGQGRQPPDNLDKPLLELINRVAFEAEALKFGQLEDGGQI
jgi:hypothetical protein